MCEISPQKYLWQVLQREEKMAFIFRACRLVVSVHCHLLDPWKFLYKTVE